MICLGLAVDQKQSCIRERMSDTGCCRVVMLSPAKFAFDVPCERCETVDYPEIIMYRTFYRLLQEIDNATLLVINECLRTQNRNDLTYNCMRHYLQQTEHQVVFQYLPQIDEFADFMTLLDWDTRTRWKGRRFEAEMLADVDLRVHAPNLKLIERRVDVDDATRESYVLKRKQLFGGLGQKDPHTIPRNLYLVTGKAKYGAVDCKADYVGRNNRFSVPGMRTYRDTSFPPESTVFELPHNFIDFADFLTLSGQVSVPVMTTALKCDQWYYQRYQHWLDRIRDAWTTLSP